MASSQGDARLTFCRPVGTAGLLSHSQFISLVLSMMMLTTTGTTFMASLGVLTQAHTGDELEALYITLYVTGGQLLGRLATMFVDWRWGKESKARIVWLSALLLTLVFGVSLFLLQSGALSFKAASVGCSVAYGAMWTGTTLMPILVTGIQYSPVYAFMSLLGALATLAGTQIAAILSSSNVFLLLLGMSGVTLAVVLLSCYVHLDLALLHKDLAESVRGCFQAKSADSSLDYQPVAGEAADD